MWGEIIGGLIVLGVSIGYFTWKERQVRNQKTKVKKEIVEMLQKKSVKTPTQIIADGVGLIPEKTSELLYELLKEGRIHRFD